MISTNVKTGSTAARIGHSVGVAVRCVLRSENALWQGAARLGVPVVITKLAKWALRLAILAVAAGTSLYFLFPVFVFCFGVAGLISVITNEDSAKMADTLFSSYPSGVYDTSDRDEVWGKGPNGKGFGFYDSNGAFTKTKD